MSKLGPLKCTEVLSALGQAGFSAVRQRDSHVRLRHPDGRVVAVSRHGPHDLGRGLLRKILRDAELTLKNFRNSSDSRLPHRTNRRDGIEPPTTPTTRTVLDALRPGLCAASHVKG